VHFDSVVHRIEGRHMPPIGDREVGARYPQGCFRMRR
jgi:hypothetical protein